MKSLGNSQKGFTIIEIAIVALIILLFAILVISNIISTRRRTEAKLCINNLKILYEAGQLYKMEDGFDKGLGGTWKVWKAGYTEERLSCPTTGEFYAAWPINEHPVCSVGTNDTEDISWDDHIYP